MRILRSAFVLLLSVLSCSIVFSGVSINARALSGGRLMDTTEALSVFGTQFTITYYNGSEYVDSTASYTGGTRQLQSTVGSYPSGAECLQYTAPVVGLSANPQYITLQIESQYSILETQQLHTAIFVYSSSSAAVPPYQTPDWRWNINGSEQIFYGELDSNDNIESVYVASDRCFYIPVDIDSQSDFTATSIRCTFVAPVTPDNGLLYFYLAPPYLSSSAYGENGIVTGTTTTGQNSGSVNVDLDETNGLLSQIIAAVSDLGDSIVDGIIGLFVPEEGTLEAFENALADLLLDTFGGVESDMLDEVIQDLLTHGATESITWPAISVPGTNFSLPSYNVPLKPAAVQNRSMYEGLALLVDMICTCWVINLIMHNIKVFLVGEKVVEVEEDDN